jgi:hypothetical protein
MLRCHHQDHQDEDYMGLVTDRAVVDPVSFSTGRSAQENFFWTPARRIWIDKGAINTGA